MYMVNLVAPRDATKLSFCPHAGISSDDAHWVLDNLSFVQFEIQKVNNHQHRGIPFCTLGDLVVSSGMARSTWEEAGSLATMREPSSLESSRLGCMDGLSRDNLEPWLPFGLFL